MTFDSLYSILANVAAHLPKSFRNSRFSLVQQGFLTKVFFFPFAQRVHQEELKGAQSSLGPMFFQKNEAS